MNEDAISRGKYARYEASCLICRRQISANLLQRHITSNSCTVKQVSCKFCNQQFSSVSGNTNHMKTCYSNPNRIQHPLAGKKGTPLTESAKGKLRAYYKHHRHPNFGGYQENAGRGKRFKVTDSYGTEVTLQSSYEKAMQELLDKHSITWIRPSYLKYDDRKYYPDFYLPEHDLYLDTKNSYLASVDKLKIESVIAQNSVNLKIVLKADISDSLSFLPSVAHGEQGAL